jgi:hypothetical protein
MAHAESIHTSSQYSSLCIHVSSESKHVYTAGDIVRGVVHYNPTSRPQHVKITFKGLCTLYNKNQEEVKFHLFQHEQELFVSSRTKSHDVLQKDTTAKDEDVELPFEFTFPWTVSEPPPSDRQWWYSEDARNHPRFQHAPGFLLPPSCAPARARGPVAPSVTYFLAAQMDSILSTHRELKFAPLAPEYNLSLLQPNLVFGSGLPEHSCRYKFIRTRKLLPGYKEKTNALVKMKNFLAEKEFLFGIETYGEIPFTKFNISTTPPRVAMMGSDLPIKVSIQHINRSSSLPLPPDIFLRRIRVRIISNYNVFVPQPKEAMQSLSDHIDRTQHTTTLIDKRFDNKEGEALYDGQNLGETIDLRLPEADDTIVPSFTSYGLTLEHEVQVEIWGECATNKFSDTTCRHSIQIMSGWTMSHVQEDAVGGLVHVHENPPPSEFPPPPYEMQSVR